MCSDDPEFENKDLFPNHVIVPEANAPSVPEEDCDKWGVGQEQLVAAQKSDVSLSHCLAVVIDKPQLLQHSTAYFFDGDVLMRKWTPSNSKHDWRSFL